MIVMKFGGTSVADTDCIVRVVEVIRTRVDRRPLVVVSALGGVTDLLEKAVAAARSGDREAQEPVIAEVERRHRWALSGCLEDAGARHDLSLVVDSLFEDLRQLLRSIRVLGEGTPRAADTLLAFGEILSSRIVCAALRSRGVAAEWVDPRAIMFTDDRFGAAAPENDRVAEACTQEVDPLLESGAVPVTGGFVGSTPSGATTTLGRGGSDTSAAVFGAAMGAEEIQIWTDVPGLMTADPRLVSGARSLESISFAEAAELAAYGAKVLHPAAIAPAVERQIPVRILNSMDPDHPGTVVLEACGPGSMPVASLASREGFAVLRVSAVDRSAGTETLHVLLHRVQEAGLEPEMVVASGVGATVVLRDDPALDRIARDLGRQGDRVQALRDQAVLCLVGSGLGNDPRVRGEVLEAVSGLEPAAVSLGGSSTGVTFVVPAARLETAVRSLHRRFFEGEES